MNQNGETGERSEDSTYNNTRRQFVAGSVGAIGGIALGSGLPGSVLAQENGDEEGGDGRDDGEADGEGDEGDDGVDPVENDFEDDVAILNYALTLEYLEARFYQQGLENISEEQFCNCQALADESFLQERVMEELTTIQQHEEQHVETLISTIESLGGTPIEEPSFDFGLAVEYPMAFLGTAAQLEDVGVSAYAGAAPSIENADLLPPALGIHSTEARHAAFLRTLSGQTSFPDVIDAPRSRSEVLELAGTFIVEEGEDGTGDDGTGDDGTDDGTGDEGTGDDGTGDDGMGDDGTGGNETNGNETNGNETNGNETNGNETNGNETGA